MPIHQAITTISHADGAALPAGMRETETIERTLYTIDELSGDARDKALNHFWSLNIDHGWWEHIYEDAATIGLEITSFDLYRKNITGRLTEDFTECCRRVMREHGKECDTRQTVRKYLKQFAKNFRVWRASEADQYKALTASDWLVWFKEEEDTQELAEEFKEALLQNYFSMLQDEYDFRTSEKQILESVRANEYLFNEDGEFAL